MKDKKEDSLQTKLYVWEQKNSKKQVIPGSWNSQGQTRWSDVDLKEFLNDALNVVKMIPVLINSRNLLILMGGCDLGFTLGPPFSLITKRKN